MDKVFASEKWLFSGLKRLLLGAKRAFQEMPAKDPVAGSRALARKT